jgi:aspartate racemase
MKTLGLIGGTSWVSTIDYYRLINELTNQRLGGVNSAKLILYSVNFKEFQPPTELSQWGPLTQKFTNIATKLEEAGAEGLVLCANTPHLIADAIQQEIEIPIIHIAEATAADISKSQLKKVALLGTRITMEQEFYKKRLSAQNIETIIPSKDDRQFIHDSILKEMCRNIFTPQMKERYLDIIDEMIKQGAEGIIFGCTEIPMLINKEECPVPSFDTTMLHVRAAVDFALN